jgi:ribosomal protein L11 methyltransferase
MNHRWLVLTIQAPSAEHASHLAEGLFAAGATAVEERPDRVITYLQPDDEQTPDAYVATLAEQLTGFNHGAPPEITWEWLPDRDWSEEWKRGLGPRRVGQRLIVAPSWTAPQAEPEDLVITIDPQMAFGTGEHASTRGALRLLERFMKPNARVLDVGTGSGVLAIAAALLGAQSVLAVEADADSLINAEENLQRNGAEERVQLVHRLVDAQYLKQASNPHFDIICANILSSVISPLLEAMKAALVTQGTLIVAGILIEEANGFRQRAEAESFTVLAEDHEEQWWSAALVPELLANQANH